jgi:hypothetical protein
MDRSIKIVRQLEETFKSYRITFDLRGKRRTSITKLMEKEKTVSLGGGVGMGTQLFAHFLFSLAVLGT